MIKSKYIKIVYLEKITTEVIKMADTKISDSVIYIGADDHDIDLFESQYVVLSLTRR